MINELIENNKWIIIAFAPGSYGYKLGKWLISNKLATVNNLQYIVDSSLNNHHYCGYFSDVLLSDGKQEDTVKKELIGHFPNFNLIKSILSDSEHLPNNFTNGTRLILTHYTQYRLLYELSLFFNNAKIIRIVFESHDQAIGAIKRKRSLDNQTFDLNNDWGDLCDNYFPFLNEFKFTIDVPVNKVKNLELNFLKELL